MELDEHLYESFRNYLTGALSKEEQAAFEERLETDEDFAQLFEEEKQFTETLQSVLFSEEFMASADHSVEVPKEAPTNPRAEASADSPFQWVLAAAVLALLCILALWNYGTGGNTMKIGTAIAKSQQLSSPDRQPRQEPIISQTLMVQQLHDMPSQAGALDSIQIRIFRSEKSQSLYCQREMRLLELYLTDDLREHLQGLTIKQLDTESFPNTFVQLNDTYYPFQPSREEQPLESEKRSEVLQRLDNRSAENR
ncbi:MAG: hypothetical protein AAFV95_17245 [Bacteroidota bacterium]